MSTQDTNVARSPSSARPTSNPKLHQVTFCGDCGQTIPARAITCYECGAKQEHAEPAIQVVFCEKCGEDYPSKSMSCLHCGHLNARHPLLRGSVAR